MPTALLVGAIGASAVPEAPHPDEDAALGHLCRDGLVDLEGVGGLIAQVAARNEARGPVLLGEVGDRPHGVADDRNVRSGQWDQLVVGVHRLGLLTGPDCDGRERRDQQPGVEDAFDDGEHVGVHRDLLERGPVDEQVVHPHRMDTLEEIVGGHGAEIVLQLEQRLVDLVDKLGLDGAGEDGVPVLGDSPKMLFQVGRGAGGFRLCHDRNCTDTEPGSSLSAPLTCGGWNWSGGRVWDNGPLAQLVAHLHDARRGQRFESSTAHSEGAGQGGVARCRRTSDHPLVNHLWFFGFWRGADGSHRTTIEPSTRQFGLPA